MPWEAYQEVPMLYHITGAISFMECTPTVIELIFFNTVGDYVDDDAEGEEG